MKYLFYILFLFSGLNAFAQASNPFLPDSTDLILNCEFYDNSEMIKLFEEEQNKKFINTYLEKFGGQYEFEKRYSEFLNKNIDDWEMNLYDVRNQQTALLNNFKAEISPKLYDFLAQDIKYNYWHLLMAYPVLRSNLDTKMKTLVSIPKIMTDELSKQKFDEKELLNSINFRKFLSFYITYFNSSEKKFEKYSDMVKSTVDKSEYAISKLNGNNLDYALATLLHSNKDKISSSATRYISSQIDNEKLQNYCKSKILPVVLKNEEKIAEKAKEDSKKKKEEIAKDYPKLVDLAGKEFNFSKYLGKVIYVDIWASWCGPCRKEFPYSVTMHKQLSEKEKKEIVFLYISIDDELNNWKDAIQKMDLGEFEHGYSKGGWNSEMVQKYKISGIPRYMIIDKTGKIAVSEAPRPSNPETLDELLKFTKK